MDNLSLQEAIKQLKTWLDQKEYDKATIGCKEILAKDPTNQEVLSLMKKADEAKSAVLKEEVKTGTPEGRYQFAKEQKPTEPKEEKVTPEVASTATPESKQEKPKPTEVDKSKEEFTPSTIEETISQPEKSEEDEENPLITSPPPPKEEQYTLETQETKEIKEQKKTRKTMILDLTIKLVVAIILAGGVYLTWVKYLKNEIMPAPEEPKIDTTLEEPAETPEETGEEFSLSPENLFKATVETVEEGIPTEEVTEEPKEKITEGPEEEEDKPKYRKYKRPLY